MTNFTKHKVSTWMLHRGHSFFKSAVLLKRVGGNKDVELYNICQGIEVVLKSFLLFRNYDKYKPLLPKRREFGHDLIKLANEVLSEYQVKALSQAQTDELKRLNHYYTNHYLRYAGVHDIFFPSTDVGYGLVGKKLLASIKLADKKLCAEIYGDASL